MGRAGWAGTLLCVLTVSLAAQKIDFAAENSISIFKGSTLYKEWNTYSIEKAGVTKVSLVDPFLKKKVEWHGVPLALLENRLGIDTDDYDMVHILGDDYPGVYIPASFYRQNKTVILATRYNGQYSNGENWPSVKRKNHTYALGPFVLTFPEDLEKKKPDASVEYRAVQVREIRWLESDDFWSSVGLEARKGDGINHPRSILRNTCLRCHMFKGIGGQRGSDFIKPLPVAKYMKKAAFVKFVSDPKNRDRDSNMFIPRDIPKKDLERLYDFLKKSAAD